MTSLEAGLGRDVCAPLWKASSTQLYMDEETSKQYFRGKVAENRGTFGRSQSYGWKARVWIGLVIFKESRQIELNG